MPTIRQTIQTKTFRVLAIVGVLGVVIAGGVVALLTGSNEPGARQPKPATLVSTGDTVVVSVIADQVDDLYGYQFDLGFDGDFIKYAGRLTSDLADIETIFAKDQGWYVLVGATMIGDAPGHSGRQVALCQVEFTALQDFELNSDFSSDHAALSAVNVATSARQYDENVDGWTLSLAVR